MSRDPDELFGMRLLLSLYGVVKRRKGKNLPRPKPQYKIFMFFSSCRDDLNKEFIGEFITLALGYSLGRKVR